MKRFTLGFLFTLLLISCSQKNIFQPVMDKVIIDDPRNTGIKVFIRYQPKTSTLIYNLQEIDGGKSAIDVFRVFMQFAEKVADTNFDEVHIAFKGSTKFVLGGDDFKTIGKEYSWQNPIYTTNHFPEKLKLLDGTAAYPTWTGGWLGVANKQMEDYLDFHKRWYLDDL